ncbi:hypothetical protein IEO21_04089 [Rhodonia placenta]|uniref:Uncharacterized protein n=1 Tax=Rhodonia placenta TaxID=104341 RepID=A0A8H7P4L8_9APHY|nr:hypothetical protein IEO21_04089 [Postia placenta]
MGADQDVRASTERTEAKISSSSTPSLLASPESSSPLESKSSSRSEKASTSPSPAEGLAMSAANFMLESHDMGIELPSSRMQMRKWETSMLDVL